MAYLSVEKETCFFSAGVSAFPSPGKLKFGHCVCLSLTHSVWGWLCSGERHLLVRGSVTQPLEMGACQHSSFNTHPSDLGLCGQVFGDVF